jgi:MYXO-CTERM domain-containing protein
VEIEASYLVGSYEITILSAEESGELNRWLDDHAYYLPDGARERLEEYIEAGSYFMVAKVSEEAQLADGSPLTPLQVSYNSPVFAIPIRLAALSAIEDQDMVIYTLTDYDQGRVAISNYPQAELNGGCIWDKDTSDFTAFYEGEVDRAMAAQEGAAWISEFSFAAGDCNPCTDYYFGDPTRFEDLGFRGVDEGAWPWVTRLRVRYSRETADQDLTLYSSSMQPQTTMSFADDSEGNRHCIESYCDGTDAEDPPAPEPVDCDTGEDNHPGLSDEKDVGFKGGMGCATAPTASLFTALGALAALGLRRRRA